MKEITQFNGQTYTSDLDAPIRATGMFASLRIEKPDGVYTAEFRHGRGRVQINEQGIIERIIEG